MSDLYLASDSSCSFALAAERRAAGSSAIREAAHVIDGLMDF